MDDRKTALNKYEKTLMIQINSDKIRVIQLTAKEQKTILRHCHSMDRDLYERIRTVRNGVLHLLEEECDRLRRCINIEADRTMMPKVKSILGQPRNRLSASPVARVWEAGFYHCRPKAVPSWAIGQAIRYTP